MSHSGWSLIGRRDKGGGVKALHRLLGRRRLVQVPQFEGLVLGGGDQQRLHRVEGQAAHRVKVAPQGELGVPALSQRLRVVGDLEGGGEGGGEGAKRINR